MIVRIAAFFDQWACDNSSAPTVAPIVCGVIRGARERTQVDDVAHLRNHCAPLILVEFVQVGPHFFTQGYYLNHANIVFA